MPETIEEWRDRLAGPKLSRAEELALERFLEAHQGAREELAEDLTIQRLLRELPPVTVSSNFTSLVLEQAKRSDQKAAREEDQPGRPFSWMPRLAFAFTAVGLLGLGAWSYQQNARKEMAESVARITTMAAVPQLDWLQDFQAIQAVGAIPEVDLELSHLLEP
jgi:anti-sigma factor RsiW